MSVGGTGQYAEPRRLSWRSKYDPQVGSTPICYQSYYCVGVKLIAISVWIGPQPRELSAVFLPHHKIVKLKLKVLYRHTIVKMLVRKLNQ